MIKIAKLNPQKLRAGQFQDELPEFFSLRDVVENNAWHNYDTVFNHILTVWEVLDNMLVKINPWIKSYLEQKVDSHIKKELLLAAVLLHDIAKTEEIAERKGEVVLFPGHEKIGAERARVILDRFDFSDKEKEMVVKIVANHGAIHLLVNPGNVDLVRQFSQLKDRLSDIFVELVLLTAADTAGSQLKDNNPEEFAFRMDFYQSFMANFS